MSKRVDARSQAPTKYMRAKVKKLAPVLTGQAVGIKLKPSVLKQYREAGGFSIINKRLVLSKDVAELPGIRRGLPMLRMPMAEGAAERIPLPIGANNMADIIEDMLANPGRWNALKTPDEYFTFKVFGHFARESHDNIEWLAEYLNRYDASVFEGFQLWRQNMSWAPPRYKEGRRKQSPHTERRLAAKAKDTRDYFERRAAHDLAYRERVKNDPVRLAKKRELERARAVQYRGRQSALRKYDKSQMGSD